MIHFLDTNIVLYFIENPPSHGPRATAHVTALLASGDTFAVSDLVRMECRVLPIRRSDLTLLNEYNLVFRLASGFSAASDKCGLRSGSRPSRDLSL